MLNQEIKQIQNLMHHEEQLADKAGSPELVAAHEHVAMLYKAELNVLRKKRAASVAEMLGNLG